MTLYTNEGIQPPPPAPNPQELLAAKSGGYRYGFNGHEKDDEVKGAGNSLDFGARIYDGRLGMWLSVDPLVFEYPFFGSYTYVANNPIQRKDIDGRKIFIYYEDADGNPMSYEYGSGLEVPNDKFVQDVVLALTKLDQSKSIEDKFDYLSTTDNYDITIKWKWSSEANPSIFDGRPYGEAITLRKEHTVRFNPKEGLIGANGKVLAPFGALWHELGHIYNALTDVEGFVSRNDPEAKYAPGSENARWTNPEEKFNIIENEHPLATEHDMLVRDGHSEKSSKTVITTGVLSTEPLKNE